ncbi:GNAT family N-acetyltransferase [Pseudobacteroides sp.]|uniref:GNAT family N-acetyltransferase n=1 Tax=Pseudobacteroides sp. TaxID=1968840 RepID=UPI0039C92E2E
MMENVNINGKIYGFVVDYKNNDQLRNSLNSLTKRIYGFDFEEWYQNGYWKDGYIPYSIVDGNNIVSNVSVNVIDFLVMGEKRTYIQIGTVMTEKEYRKKGLNGFLMEKVLGNWRGRCDLIYLFANDSVLDFYPKFGFNSAHEYQHSKEIFSENNSFDFVKLNMSDEENKNFLFNKVNQSLHFSQISMDNKASLVMFYCTSFMDQNVYYIKRFDAVVIAEFNESILYINDIFCEKEVLLNDIILSMTNKEIKKVVLGFTPKDTASFDATLLKQEDTTLFILDDRCGIFDNKKIMFPILSHA